MVPRADFPWRRCPSRPASWRRRRSRMHQAAFGQAMVKTAVVFTPLASKARSVPASAAYHESGAAVLSGFLETVSDPVESLDHLEFVVDDFELLAQPLDVAVDGAVVDINLVVVSSVHQRVAALADARARGERLQNEKFRYRECDRLVLPRASVALRVHAQEAAVERLGVGFLWHRGRIFWGGTAQHGLHVLYE